jgi:3,4-dihydroxy 2-butanone 4-phosphate synthase/GTP cyclohydrolase II
LEVAVEFSTIRLALRDLEAGRFIIVVDDEDRENEGDLIMAAAMVTPEAVNFAEHHARGLLCVPMDPEIADQLDLPLMVAHNTSLHGTAYTVTVDAASGVTTGISAQDRARAIRLLSDPGTRPKDLARPGHVQPLRADPGGVLRRAGHTEATVDLVRLAGQRPVGVLCEMKNADGSMARLPDLQVFAQEHGIRIITVADLIEYRRRHEKLIDKVAEGQLPTRYGTFRFRAYSSKVDGRGYVALIMGDVAAQDAPLVRVHSSCLTGDVFKSLRCDCGDQLELALERIVKAGAGVLLYIDQEGRGIGLLNKLRAYTLQDQGRDTVAANEELGFAADLREYGIGAQVLTDLGLRRIRLMTNNKRKLVGLAGYGIEIVERVPVMAKPRKENLEYLRTKKERLGHLLDLTELEPAAAGDADKQGGDRL